MTTIITAASPPTAIAPTVVLGGTGKTGRRITERLAALGAPVRSVARSTKTPFDWADRNTWSGAIAGSVQAYIAYAPDLAVPGALDDVAELTARLVDEGVKRIVLLSGRGEPDALAAEDLVVGSGLECTILRCSWFFQNFTEGYLRDAVVHGAIRVPAGAVSEPFVDTDDIADVAVAALTGGDHVGELYELGGPELLSFRQIAEAVTRHTGRPTTYVPIEAQDFSHAMRQEGVPDNIVALLDYLFEVVLDGRNASLTDGVHRALGREPRSFEDFARNAAASGLWQN